MTMRVPTPPETVALIKAIVNMDLRERRRAGFIRGTWHLAERIAETLDMKLETVLKIKERKRHKRAGAANLKLFQKPATVPIERLEKIRQRRIRAGTFVVPLDGFHHHWHQGSWSPKERILRLGRQHREASKFMADHIFATANNWALASDGIQWMLMKRHSRKTGDTFDPVCFVHSTRDVLARCMREKGVEDGTARLLLAGLPDTFDQWKALHPSQN